MDTQGAGGTGETSPCRNPRRNHYENSTQGRERSGAHGRHPHARAGGWGRGGPSPSPRPTSDAAFEAPPVDTGADEGRLGQVLVSRGVVTDSQVAAALKAQADSGGKRLGEVLVDMGALDERGLADALADFFGMPVTDLKRDTPEPSALALVPAEFARGNLAIPLRVDDDALHVAVAQPSDELRFLLSDVSGHSVRLSVAPMTDIRWAIDRSYQALDSVGKLVQAFEAVETTRKRPAAEARRRPLSPERAGRPGGGQHPDPGRTRPGLRCPH